MLSIKKVDRNVGGHRTPNANVVKEYMIETLTFDNAHVDSTEAVAILMLNNTKVKVKLDTGAEVNVLPKRVWGRLEYKPFLEKTHTKLRGYGGNYLKVLGVCSVTCQHINQMSPINRTTEHSKFYVNVETNSKTILGLQKAKPWV